ncbi:cation-dependent mannose-6-phosphate receptor-like [Symsagittifera roscoffensis]|uniref:cation-dependent mannose-6-phosphate receptor-like n=1 Tax=Symsagittifera roscoffensis TaxID=84072 RepID=UPI00307C94A7
MPCGTISSLPSAACAGSKGCQQDGIQYNPMGDPTGAICNTTQDNEPKPTVTYKGVASGGSSIKRGINITYTCDQSTPELPFTVGQNELEVDTYYYPFAVTGSGACLQDIGGGGGGLTGAGIFLIIYFVSIAIYLIAGICYKALYKGARGMEMIPNTEFWMMVPGLIRDGCLFIYRWIAGKTYKKSFDAV